MVWDGTKGSPGASFVSSRIFRFPDKSTISFIYPKISVPLFEKHMSKTGFKKHLPNKGWEMVSSSLWLDFQGDLRWFPESMAPHVPGYQRGIRERFKGKENSNFSLWWKIDLRILQNGLLAGPFPGSIRWKCQSRSYNRITLINSSSLPWGMMSCKLKEIQIRCIISTTD